MSLLRKASIVTTPTSYENGKILSVKPSVILGEELVNASTNNLSGWIDARSNANLSIVNNNIRVNYVSGTTMGVSTAITTIVGKTYSVKVNGTRNNTNGGFYVRVANNSSLSGSVFELTSANNSISADATFVATQTTHYVGILATVQGTNDYIQASLVLVKEVLDADFDFTRNSSATRVNSQGLIEDMQILSSNLVSNGDFATDSDWNKINSTISGGTGNLDGDGQTSLLYQNILTNGKTYKVTFTVSDYNSLGEARIIESSGSAIYTITSNGTFTFTFTHSNADGNFLFRARNGAIFSVDNVSVIEITDDTNLPRIDYTGGEGHWLFEPQSTQTATYSNDFTQGDIFNSSTAPQTELAVITSQQAISPDSTNNAWLLKDDNSGGNGQPNLRYFNTSVNSNDFNTLSIFVKKALTNNFIALSTAGFDGFGSGNSWFNISNGTLGTIGSSHTAKIEDYGNNWYRCSITFKTTTDTTGAVRIRLASTDGSTGVSLDGTNGVYLFGLQCEADATQNYATSYIPTNGEVNGVTRLADTAFGAGSSDLINSTEGVLYAEIAALSEGQSVTTLTISDGSLSNRVLIALLIGELRGQFVSSANNILRTTSGVTIEEFNKIACSYTSTTFKVFVNGTQLGTTFTSLTAVTGLNELAFNRGDGALDFIGKAKCVAVFKEALNNDELECLTGEGYDSFNALALANNYTII